MSLGTAPGSERVKAVPRGSRSSLQGQHGSFRLPLGSRKLTQAPGLVWAHVCFGTPAASGTSTAFALPCRHPSLETHGVAAHRGVALREPRWGVAGGRPAWFWPGPSLLAGAGDGRGGSCGGSCCRGAAGTLRGLRLLLGSPLSLSCPSFDPPLSPPIPTPLSPSSVSCSSLLPCSPAPGCPPPPAPLLPLPPFSFPSPAPPPPLPSLPLPPLPPSLPLLSSYLSPSRRCLSGMCGGRSRQAQRAAKLLPDE